MSLSGLQLARMRRTADSVLPESGEVYRPTYTSDGAGGQTMARTRIWSGPVRVAPVSSVVTADATTASRQGGSQGVWITLPHHVDLRLDDRIVVGSHTYEVSSFDTGRSWHVSQRVLATELA